MILVRAEEGHFGHEFLAMGETIEEAIKKLAEVCEDIDYCELTFFDVEQLTVKKTVKYEIV